MTSTSPFTSQTLKKNLAKHTSGLQCIDSNKLSGEYAYHFKVMISFCFELFVA
jgi:hypothetical protein